MWLEANGIVKKMGDDVPKPTEELKKKVKEFFGEGDNFKKAMSALEDEIIKEQRNKISSLEFLLSHDKLALKQRLDEMEKQQREKDRETDRWKRIMTEENYYISQMKQYEDARKSAEKLEGEVTRLEEEVQELKSQCAGGKKMLDNVKKELTAQLEGKTEDFNSLEGQVEAQLNTLKTDIEKKLGSSETSLKEIIKENKTLLKDVQDTSAKSAELEAKLNAVLNKKNGVSDQLKLTMNLVNAAKTEVDASYTKQIAGLNKTIAILEMKLKDNAKQVSMLLEEVLRLQQPSVVMPTRSDEDAQTTTTESLERQIEKYVDADPNDGVDASKLITTDDGEKAALLAAFQRAKKQYERTGILSASFRQSLRRSFRISRGGDNATVSVRLSDLERRGLESVQQTVAETSSVYKQLQSKRNKSVDANNPPSSEEQRRDAEEVLNKTAEKHPEGSVKHSYYKNLATFASAATPLAVGFLFYVYCQSGSDTIEYADPSFNNTPFGPNIRPEGYIDPEEEAQNHTLAGAFVEGAVGMLVDAFFSNMNNVGGAHTNNKTENAFHKFNAIFMS